MKKLLLVAVIAAIGYGVVDLSQVGGVAQDAILSGWSGRFEDVVGDIFANVGNSFREGEVVNVVDGDTIDVIVGGEEQRVRLIGVNTPETVDPRRPVECFGREASARTVELALGQRVRLESDPTQADRDRYDRLLRYVVFEDGRELNQVLIEEGYAYEYTYDVAYVRQAEYEAAELVAKEGARGLWGPGVCE